MNENQPLVSVIIPTYNRAQIIRRAIESAQKQTYRNWEILVIDDASTDNTKTVVDAFGGTDIRYIRHGSNRGGGAARNTGIVHAKGEFVAFLDSDDEWRPRKLERQVRTITATRSQVAATYTGLVFVDGGGVRKRSSAIHRGNLYRELLTQNVVGSCSSVLVRRRVLERVGGFDANLPSSQDHDLWLRIAESYCYEYVSAFDTIIHASTERDRISTAKYTKGRGMLVFYRKHQERLADESKEYGYLRHIGYKFQMRFGERRAARTCYLASIRKERGQLLAYLLLVSTYTPIEKARRLVIGCRNGVLRWLGGSKPRDDQAS